jgi:elongation factor Ts
MIKALRELTGAGVMDCKRALEAANGQMEAAQEALKQRGLAQAEKKVNRVASQGLVECYIHAGGRIGSMVEVNCETDFVARTDEFKELAHNLAMQVAAMNPSCVDEDELPQDGDVDPSQACLLLQTYIRDPNITVRQLIIDAIAKVGENIKVQRFARFELGN